MIKISELFFTPTVVPFFFLTCFGVQMIDSDNFLNETKTHLKSNEKSPRTTVQSFRLSYVIVDRSSWVTLKNHHGALATLLLKNHARTKPTTKIHSWTKPIHNAKLCNSVEWIFSLVLMYNFIVFWVKYGWIYESKVINIGIGINKYFIIYFIGTIEILWMLNIKHN